MDNFARPGRTPDTVTTVAWVNAEDNIIKLENIHEIAPNIHRIIPARKGEVNTTPVVNVGTEPGAPGSMVDANRFWDPESNALPINHKMEPIKSKIGPIDR